MLLSKLCIVEWNRPLIVDTSLLSHTSSNTILVGSPSFSYLKDNIATCPSLSLLLYHLKFSTSRLSTGTKLTRSDWNKTGWKSSPTSYPRLDPSRGSSAVADVVCHLLSPTLVMSVFSITKVSHAKENYISHAESFTMHGVSRWENLYAPAILVKTPKVSNNLLVLDISLSSANYALPVPTYVENWIHTFLLILYFLCWNACA